MSAFMNTTLINNQYSKLFSLTELKSFIKSFILAVNLLFSYSTRSTNEYNPQFMGSV